MKPLETHLDEIEAKAKAATPGSWLPHKHRVDEIWDIRFQHAFVARVLAPPEPQNEPNAEHIAHMNPERTLKLVAAMRVFVDEMSAMCCCIPESKYPENRVCRNCTALANATEILGDEK